MAQQNRSIGTILRINLGISKFSNSQILVVAIQVFRTCFFSHNIPMFCCISPWIFPMHLLKRKALDLSGLPWLRNGLQLPKCFALLATQIDTVASWEATVTLGNVTATVGRNWEFEDDGWVNWCWMVGGVFNSRPFFLGLEGYWEIGGGLLYFVPLAVCVCAFVLRFCRDWLR